MITTQSTINLASQVAPPIIQAVQGDTGRAVSFALADYTVPEGATATYYIAKPSGEAVYNTATISGNNIICELTAQSLAELGENNMQVRIIKDEDIVTSFDVILLVRPFRGIDAIESGTEMNIFDQAVEQAAEDFQSQAEQIVEDVIESIPADYTELTEEVDELNERFDSEIADVKSVVNEAINNTNDSLLQLNGIPVNVEQIDISDSIITQAGRSGVQLTVTGINKFKLNGTANSPFTIPLDFGKTEINGSETLYYLINRSDGVIRQDGTWIQLGYFDANDDAHQPTDTISVFNTLTSYTYPSDAASTRNYLRVPNGASFTNTEFEIVILRKTPVDTSLLNKVDDLLLSDTYENILLTWESATGYWASNKTFATYSGISTATIDVTPNAKYLLSARSYYGMCIGVFYKGNTVSAESITDIIYLSNDDEWHRNYEVTASPDAQHLLLQAYSNVYATISDVDINTVPKTILSGKLIAYNGDSICESRFHGTAANGGAYAYLISKATGCTYVNLAVSGGILASAVPSGTMPHSVVNTLGQLPDDADLYCIEGGVNDFWRDVPLGDYSPIDYNATVDTTTVCGALEHIIRAITYYHVGKPLVFVLVHKATATINANNAGYTFDQMREKMIGILNKYAIPYYDAYLYSGLNGYNSIQSTTFLTANSTGAGDGIHPNEAGYIRYYVPQLTALFNSLMPIIND